MPPSPREIFQSHLRGFLKPYPALGRSRTWPSPPENQSTFTHWRDVVSQGFSRVLGKKNVECHHSGAVEMEVDTTV